MFFIDVDVVFSWVLFSGFVTAVFNLGVFTGIFDDLFLLSVVWSCFSLSDNVLMFFFSTIVSLGLKYGLLYFTDNSFGFSTLLIVLDLFVSDISSF